MKTYGKIYLLPTFLGESTAEKSFPKQNVDILKSLRYFAVENQKSARRFIKQVCPEKKQAELELFLLNKRTTETELPEIIAPVLEGNDLGILSEAGMPGIADPGSTLVALAHKKGIEVVPLVGPSSILLALVASGFNGQSFSFHGYLPIDAFEKKKAIQQLENKSRKQKSAEIFMETPYRNQRLFEDLLKTLHPSTQLCVACDISLESQFILSTTIADWKKRKADLHKRPAIFIIQA